MYEENDRKILTSNVILLILKLLLLAIFIFILCWLFISNRDEKKSNEVDSAFITNINAMKAAAFEYFTTDKLPTTIGESQKVTLKQMLEDKLLLDFTNNGQECKLDESYIAATKTSDTKYALKINLSCKKATDFIITSIEKEEISCSTCQNIQNPAPVETQPTEDKNTNSNPDVTNTPNNNNNNNNSSSNSNSSNNNTKPSTTTKPQEKVIIHKYYDLQSNNSTT